MKKFEKTFTFEKNISIKITRILLDEDIFKYKMIPIDNDADFSFGYYIQEDPLILPKLYVGLRYLTGAGDTRYDDYKGSYSFYFRLEVNKNGKMSSYLFHLYHYRSYIEFALHQLVKEVDPGMDLQVMRPPAEELFSNEDIRYFVEYFCGYVLGFLEECGHTPEPFIKGSDSNLLVFGYREGNYFYEEYDDCGDYKKARNKKSQESFEKQ